MTDHDLKPWSLRPLGTGVLVAFLLFTACIAGLMLYTLPTMQVTLLSKLLILILTLSGLGCAASLFMWSRYWPDVAWDVSFFRFISDAAPSRDYPEALQAWRWGRRYVACWVVLMAAMFLIPLVEYLSEKWSAG